MRLGHRFGRLAWGVVAVSLIGSAALAEDAASAVNADTAAPRDAGGSGSPGNPISDYLDHYWDHVRAAQASQPHWMTPVATVTPRLEQEFRYDQFWQHQGNGGNLTSYDGGKGLELIPTESNEVLINLPPYQARSVKKPASGLGDWSFLTIKQRFLSANEQNGNYILTGFLGFQAPTGISKYTNDAWMITPTLAGGKGWGRWDLQGTVGAPLPLSHQHTIGYSVVTNVALQYHLGELLWPELEANSTYWASGPREGKTQVFLTPGLILGRIPLVGRTKLIAGVGYQIAVSPRQALTPVLTPTYRQAWILTTRLAF